MNKKYFLLLLSLLVSPFIFVSNVYAQTAVGGHKVIIDAGHGGSDYGSMECSALPEKIANLQVAQLLQARLISEGATVYMTRTDDSSYQQRSIYRRK